jgi:lipopolysaccharide/colanic/teichoic acid biosynthesis glycosyltransferase
MVVLFRVLLMMAFAVAVTSKRPVLFSQQRVDKDGRPSTVPRSLSKRTTAEQDRMPLGEWSDVSGSVFGAREVHCFTPWGKFTGKLSFVELQRFWNLLCGGTSRVGRQPPLPHDVDEYTVGERQRLIRKPGTAGIWRLSPRTDIDFEAWVSDRYPMHRGVDSWLQPHTLVQDDAGSGISSEDLLVHTASRFWVLSLYSGVSMRSWEVPRLWPLDDSIEFRHPCVLFSLIAFPRRAAPGPMIAPLVGRKKS